ncbi:MAG TPA: molybdopterin-guanine dinucleotide biosynthesis protein B [Aliidongia sp.]|nr:molybdopterin-guanine dinucleotide biosynthesis protein B [Aliidongia sp.]
MKVFGIIGSCEAKASVVVDVVEDLVRRGHTVSTVKRVRDDVDLDQRGKDTYRQRQAGAREIIIASSFRWALLHERTDGFHEPEIAPLIARLDPVDFVIAEGFRTAPIPKLEIVRIDATRRPQYLDDPSVIALASDGPSPSPLTTFPVSDIRAIAACVVRYAMPVGAVPRVFELEYPAMPFAGAGLN